MNQSTSDEQAQSPKLVMIEAFNGMALEVATCQEGDTLRLKRRTEENNQKFTLRYINQNYFTLQCYHSDQYLQIESDDQRAKLIQKRYSGDNKQQQFKTESLADGFVAIFSRSTGFALDVECSRFEDGTTILQWPFNRGHNQKFRIQLWNENLLF